MLDFRGAAKRLSSDAIHKAAEVIGCDIAAIKAVIDVESRGGYLSDGRPKILFERHVFSKRTNGRFDASHPDISSSRPGGYKGNAAEYDRLARATALDRDAALKSASWGAFQIMGYHHAAVGHAGVDDFCRAMCDSEDEHLEAFVQFVKVNRLDDELCRRDWAGFARGYNGPAYLKNRYDTKLRAAYTLHAMSPPRAEPVERTLKMGDDGDDVEWLQERLGLPVDGDFGPATKAAVMAFQKAHGLQADGVAGIRTQEALKAAP
jgi:peptidoglycan hydrolase-like protein with peptidoglycan-binding domain